MTDNVDRAARDPGDHAPASLTDRQRRARDLEFRSFAVAAFEVLLGLTGVWFFVWPVALLLSGAGLAWATGAWRMRDRRPRFVAPILAVLHVLAFAAAGFGVWLLWAST